MLRYGVGERKELFEENGEDTPQSQFHPTKKNGNKEKTQDKARRILR